MGQAGVVNDIQGQIDRCIETPLRHLMRLGVWRSQTGGNSFTYAFTALKALETFRTLPEHSASKNLEGHFYLLGWLFELKGAVGNHGVGTGYGKVVKFEGAAAKSGVASHFKKSELFRSLLEMFEGAVRNSQSQGRSQAGEGTSQESGTSQEERERDGGGGNGRGRDATKNNPKLKKLAEILDSHFTLTDALLDNARGSGSSKAIVFTDRRSSVIEIVEVLLRNARVRPHKFIGQSRSGREGGGRAGGRRRT